MGRWGEGGGQQKTLPVSATCLNGEVGGGWGGGSKRHYL